MIRVHGVGKKYRLGQYVGAGTLRDLVSSIGRRGKKEADDTREVWALRDVDLDVREGDTVGIIGRNGAGKSTLLKLLSRITPPTTGEIRLRGRVASLLEVGTGFHPDLTGRENIFLNSAILGMSRSETRRKFDEIVAFAEIDRFLDTPVKRYSSGMYVRLAFAVAAHLESEILLVDEVLAVGDYRFQEKCLARMGEAAGEGRTVLFVSHTMAAVTAFCRRGVLLDRGGVVVDGSAADAISAYMGAGIQGGDEAVLSAIPNRRGNGKVRFRRFWIERSDGTRGLVATLGEPASMVMELDVDGQEPVSQVDVTVVVRSALGPRLFYHQNVLQGAPWTLPPGRSIARFSVGRLAISPGRYVLDLFACRDGGHTFLDALDGEVGFEVLEGDFFGSGRHYNGGSNALVLVDGTWSLAGSPSGE
jgi:lipopolysaccharide transport system ATP-binding protein